MSKGKSLVSRSKLVGVILLAMSICSLFLLAGCGGGEAPAEEKTGIAVETEVVGTRDITDNTLLKGYIEPGEEVYLVPKASGTVMDVRVSLGDRVSAGDVICVMDSSDLQAQLQQAQASYNTALSGYNEAMKNKSRMETLYKEGAVSLQQLEQARGAVERSGLDAAAASVKMIKDQMDNYIVRATISGTVAELNVQPGAMGSPQSPVVRIVNLDNVKIKAALTESNVNKVKEGQSIEVAITAASAMPFTGTIKNIAPAANMQNMTFPVEIVLANKEGLIKAGMFGEVMIDTEKREGVIAVPKTAISTENTVYVVKDNKVGIVQLETGKSDEKYTEVLSGLVGGEVVVTNGQHLLYDGAEVRDVTAANQSK